MIILLQFVIGLIFGLGLVISGMSNPAKVLNFLDVAAIPAGTWDASLAFVMAAAVIVTFIGFRFVLRRQRPFFGEKFHLPVATGLDARILTGPAIFGVGWGLAGFCPGPALTSLGSALGGGSPTVYLFVAAMLTGMVAGRWLGSHQPAALARQSS